MRQANMNQTKMKQTKINQIRNRALVFLAAFAALCAVGTGSCVNPGDSKTLQSIDVTKQPVKTQYNLNDTLDTTGMVVTATYSDGSTEAITGYTTSGFSSTTTGSKTITVSYKGKTTTFTVMVNPPGKTLQSIAVTTPPTKIQYNLNETLDTAGMVVTATYSDDTTEAVTGYTTSGFSSTTPGDKTVTVSYGGKTATFTVTVTSVPVTGITLTKKTLTLIAGQNETLTFTIAPDNAANKNVTWTSSNNTVATVANGKVTAVAAGTATITVKTVDGNKTDTCQVTVTAPSGSIMSLPPMKDQFSDYFLMGNIFNPGDANAGGTAITNTALTRHYNVLTPENDMKPSFIATDRNASTENITYNFTTADRMVNAANASNIKVVGHTLLWHSQNANWVWSQIASKTGTAIANKQTALNVMKKYITDVATHFAGKLYSWDVLNEVFPDNASPVANWKNAIRVNADGEGQDANPWYVAIGSDFVYEGFLAARQADPAAILYYNDYNCDNSNRARLIRDMVQEVNNKYATETNKPAGEAAGRLLIEGIGMQSHHNTNVTKAQIKATLDLFRPLGVRISISELDILGQTYSEFSSSTGSGPNKHTQSTVTAQGLQTQTRLYGEYMELFLDYSDIIERVSLWGVTDDKSWRSGGLPLLFKPDGAAKEAYYSFVGALPGGGGGGDPDDELVISNPTLTAVGSVAINGNSVTISSTDASNHGFYYTLPSNSGSYTNITVNFKVTAYTTGIAKFTAKNNTPFSDQNDLVSTGQYIDIGSSVNSVKAATYPLSACTNNLIAFQHNAYSNAGKDNENVNYTVQVTFTLTK